LPAFRVIVCEMRMRFLKDAFLRRSLVILILGHGLSAWAAETFYSFRYDKLFTTSADQGGEPPISILLPLAAEALRFVGVIGEISNGVATVGPDGNLIGEGEAVQTLRQSAGTLVSRVNGLSSIAVLHRFAFLTGIFLSSSPVPAEQSPGLVFTDNDSLETIGPALNQPFFIGDGLTGTGSGRAFRITLIPPSDLSTVVTTTTFVSMTHDVT
jgi:hypothetical protein